MKQRLAYLDNLKVLLVVGVIAVHSAVTYEEMASGVVDSLTVVIVIGWLFGLGLFFLIAGRLSSPSLDRQGPGPFARERLIRLGTPVLVERLFMAAVGTWDVLAVYIGDRLGLYRRLAERGPSTSAELAQAAGLNERYAREWLEQQASSAILALEEAATDPASRRYPLPPGHDEALVHDASLNCIAPLGQLVVACGRPIDAVLDAFRTGDGVPYADYGTDLHEGQARFTRPMFDQLLTSEWLPAVTSVDERLRADPPARVADVACGEGRSSMAIERGYPKVPSRRYRHGCCVNRGGAPPPGGQWPRGTRRVPSARRRRRGARRQLRPGLHPRGAARHVVSGRGTYRLPRTAPTAAC